ncbi:nucleoside-diphosphate sugar epimerase/dehydratase [Rhodoferax sp.]|uniref:polysaccharide biosynthesis protein n=1 Tax=Rhodoferax sp. TaxID=50421 RepID=UPI0026003494|nr:nucleoside-diphosphate sugar epimerase/dehydratase [Rhodoferax sp.]
MRAFLSNQHAILQWSRSTKRLVVVTLDVILGLFAMWLAFTLRLDRPHWPTGAQWAVYALGPVLSVPIFVRFGLYRAIFRYTGMAALTATAQAVGIYTLWLIVLLQWLQWMQWEVIPRSIGILQPLIFLLLVGASRSVARYWLAGLDGGARRTDARLLIYGAGNAGVQTAAALGSTRTYTLLGFVDDDAAKTGRSINGVPVYGPQDIPGIVHRENVTDILLAIPSVSRERRNEILQTLQTLPVHVRTLPGLSDLASGRVTVQDIRELDIEDLLGREPIPPHPELLARNLTDKTVLVTGAGGSIGGELCRQIVAERPLRLVLVDHNEFGLYTIHAELQTLCSQCSLDVELVPLLGSVGHYARMLAICTQYRPATVYHAAAYKHVPLVESNPAEGILNNVFGTLNMARAAVTTSVAHFVLVSTDKAVRPTNVMGATKRIAELILQALAASPVVQWNEDTSSPNTTANNTLFAMVRFGNVLGSSGSVVPLFRKQLVHGGPLTVTHPEVTRYFMTIPEAAQLVLQAGAMAYGGDVFVLDMGEPIKIIDLALRMVALSGLTVRNATHPDGDIEIAITGLRPGEKLYEELLTGDNPQTTAHPRIMQAREKFIQWDGLTLALADLKTVLLSNDVPQILRLLGQLVPDASLRLSQTQTAATI